MEYNTEWLFLEKWDKRWSSATEAQQHLHDVAALLAGNPADIYMLAEVESCNVLAELVNEIGDPDLEYYLVKGTDSATGQNVGILTRVTPSAALWRSSARADYPSLDPGANDCGLKDPPSGSSGVSKHLVASFTLSPDPSDGPTLPRDIVLIGAHLLAFPDDKVRCLKRQAQADVLASLVRDSLGSTGDVGVVVLGDFNDFDGQVLDVAGSMPISTVLAQLKDVDERFRGDEMVNVAFAADPADRFTAYYSPGTCRAAEQGSSSIDHILVSRSLASAVSEVSFIHEYPPPCQEGTAIMSDHWPVVVTLVAGTSVGPPQDSVDPSSDVEGGSGFAATLVLVLVALGITAGFALYKHRKVVASWYEHR